MAPCHAFAFDIEGRSGEVLGDALNFGGCDEQKDGPRIDETANQPGTGDPVHLRPTTRHPDCAAFRIARRQDGFRHHRQAGSSPAGNAAFESLRRNPLMAQARCDALAERATVTAGDHGRAAAKRRRPRRDVDRGSPQCSGNEQRFGREYFVRPDVNERWPGRDTDQASELIR